MFVPPRAMLITPPGQGGIGIIAVCDDGAAAVIDRVFVGTRRGAGELPPGALAHGVIQRNGDAVDEVIVAHLCGELQRYEVNCHGGAAAVRAVMGCLESAGARLTSHQEATPLPDADPLCADSVRTAALAALPSAPTRLAVTMLLHQAAGALAREAACPERRAALRATAPLGLALLRPPRVALIGPPNAGKSTLLNTLLAEERVIVHHEPGTTRDIVSETVAIRGVPFLLMDTAGIRHSADDIERSAVQRAEGLAADCDVALVLFDIREGPDDALAALPTAARIVMVANKCDAAPEAAPPPGAVAISARDHLNIAALEDALLAPYLGHLEACRAGAATVFTEAQAGSLCGNGNYG
jgi:tRNA modification GTPase